MPPYDDTDDAPLVGPLVGPGQRYREDDGNLPPFAVLDMQATYLPDIGQRQRRPLSQSRLPGLEWADVFPYAVLDTASEWIIGAFMRKGDADAFVEAMNKEAGYEE